MRNEFPTEWVIVPPGEQDETQEETPAPVNREMAAEPLETGKAIEQSGPRSNAATG